MAPVLQHIRSTGRGYVEPLLEVANGLPLHMVLIPEGDFLMGSPEDESERTDDEGPHCSAYRFGHPLCHGYR